MEKIGPPRVPRPEVGREVRHWRRERSLTLQDLAERSALNVGYLSQIENDKALPSLEALAAIAGALDVPIAWLFLEGSPPPRVVRRADRRTLDGQPDSPEEVDGGIPRDLRILEACVPPGHRSGLHAHAGDEHHVILSGRFRMRQGDHVFELEPGDYLLWDASVPHDVENIGSDEGRMLLVYPRRARNAGVARTAPPGD